MQINFIVLLVVVGIFLILAHPFQGALWVGIVLIVGGFYWARRFGTSLKRKNLVSDYEREK